MHRMVFLFAFAFALLAHASAPAHAESEPLRVLMTVGGVGYNTSIIRSLRADPEIDLVLRDVDDDPVVFTQRALKGVDAVLMYHRDHVAEPEEREALLQFLEEGGGVVVLHHSIANYPAWDDWWRDHLGGLYVLADHKRMPPSQYFYGFSGVARPTMEHPVTARLGPFWRYEDESYDRLWVSSKSITLLTTSAFGSQPELAWIGPSPSNRVVYIQPGHGGRVMADPRFLTLIEDALQWTARD